MERIFRLWLAYSICILIGVPKLGADAPFSEARTNNPSLPPSAEERLRLDQLDPVEVGHVYTMELEPGRFYQVKTAAIKPPVFLIPDFLTPEECVQLKALAEAKGLENSRTLLREPVDHDTLESTIDTYFNTETFQRFDGDNNQYLDMEEARQTLYELKGVSALGDTKFQRFIGDVLDLDSDGLLSSLEFRRIPIVLTEIEEWLKAHENDDDEDLAVKDGRGQPRVSQQVWLDPSDYDPNDVFMKRLTKLTGLHSDIIESSENLQVVRYTPGGHYHAHHDSSPIHPTNPCPHTKHLYPAIPAEHLAMERLCRYITVLYYLVDTEEGGETAFPAADNETYSEERASGANGTVDLMDLTHHCKDANLYLRPRKGMAVMWYNHYMDEKTGWLGEQDLFSLHGGCDVIKGEKWIANNWINIDSNYDVQLKFHDEALRKPNPERTHTDQPDTQAEQITQSQQEPSQEQTSQDNLQENNLQPTSPEQTGQRHPRNPSGEDSESHIEFSLDRGNDQLKPTSQQSSHESPLPQSEQTETDRLGPSTDTVEVVPSDEAEPGLVTADEQKTSTETDAPDESNEFHQEL